MKKNLRLLLMTIFMVGGMLSSSMSFGQATLKHQYTFEEGTYEGTIVYDQVGNADGELIGDAVSIDSGKVTVTGATGQFDGYVSLDAAEIALYTYDAISIEMYLETFPSANSGYTMLTYFGNNNAGDRSFWFQPTINGNASRVAVKNTSPVAQLDGTEVDDGDPHHVVAILTPDDVKYYLDGVNVAQVSTNGTNHIPDLDTVIANIFKGCDGWTDPNYNGSVLEFNIYDGELDAFTIGQRAGVYLGLDLYNASLDTITVSPGTLNPAFTSDNDLYEVEVPYGITSVTFTATPTVGGASLTMYNGLGEELTDGVLTFDKELGEVLEIVVTALDGSTEQTYLVDVFPEAGESAATLSSIDLSAGKLIGDFDMFDTAYVALVPTGSASVDVTGVPNWEGASVTGDGTIALTDGMGSTTITVTSEDGSATMSYTLEIFESNFEPGTDVYLVHETNGFVATESGDTTFNQIILAEAVHDSTPQIWQFVESGVADQYYIMNKDGHYMALSNSGAVYDMEVYPELPGDPDSARFMVNEFEPDRFKIISVARQTASATANMVGPNNGQLGSALFSDKAPGGVWDAAGFTVWNIKSPEDVVSAYETHLSALTMTGASFKPAFDPAYTSYIASIPAGVSSVEIAATAMDAAATVTGTGTIDVSDGAGVITITVAASDPQYTREYKIHYMYPGIRHQFTFEDGTYDANMVYDQVGSVNGTIGGDSITIADGKATVSGATSNSMGWISMDGEALALHTFSEITIEVMLEAQNMANSSYTMLTYFGTSTPGNGCLWIQPSRAGNETRVETNNGNNTINAVLSGYEIDDGLKHHVAVVLDKESLKYYLDGEIIAESSTNGMDYISTIGTDVANIFRGVDGWNDPNYNSSLYEYNLWEGGLDEATIMDRAIEFLGDASRDATLSSLTVDVGEIIPGFNPEVTSYEVLVPAGTETVTVTAVPNDENATTVGDTIVDVSSGKGSTDVVVTSEFGTQMTYSITFSTPAEYTLMHSYTFEEGTYEDTTVFDQVGDADGTLIGGTISGGAYIASEAGDHITFPAADMAVNMYPAITVEIQTMDDPTTTNGSNTMLTYFGNTNASNNYGYNYFFTSLGNGGNTRASISCGDDSTPWSVESGVTTPSVMDDGNPHHLVGIVTEDEVKLYVDGVLAGTTALAENNSLSLVDITYAYLCKGGYTADPTYLGEVHEYNIYSGAMDGATVAKHAKQYLGGLTLMHSYTFDDGTADDVVGDADGTLMGAGTIADGAYTAAANGDYIELPAADIAINNYYAITLESYIYSDVDNTGATMMAYFGGNENDVGGNGYFLTPDRWTESRTAISCGNVTEPWLNEQGVTGSPVAVGEKHYVVSVLTDSTIALYIDGALVDQAEVSDPNSIAALSTANAWLCKGGYSADPTWMGTIDEFNIWEGAMDSATVAERYDDFLTAIPVQNTVEANIKVYPTYSTGDFKVETDGSRGMISVYSLTGKLVLQKEIESSLETVTVRDRGMYIMRVENKESFRTFKVFKTR
ncbi:LamG-like jellyroll fold domain-containing protein [Maribellus mangrovi]|uniref:LamG-like jellyroll fold domain-containing protein n=1 Tax=Maribellus mangrovi TaxID=3133146 RepID=UPI0030EEAF44